MGVDTPPLSQIKFLSERRGSFQMTGMWTAVAQLRDTFRYDSVKVVFSEDSPGHYSSKLMLNRLILLG